MENTVLVLHISPSNECTVALSSLSFSLYLSTWRDDWHVRFPPTLRTCSISSAPCPFGQAVGMWGCLLFVRRWWIYFESLLTVSVYSNRKRGSLLCYSNSKTWVFRACLSAGHKCIRVCVRARTCSCFQPLASMLQRSNVAKALINTLWAQERDCVSTCLCLTSQTQTHTHTHTLYELCCAQPPPQHVLHQ